MSGDLTFETIGDADRFRALEGEWNDLWLRTRQRQFSHRHVWFRLGWETTGAPRGRRMHVLVVRRQGRAVLIWPLALHRRLLWWQARALGPEFTEYDAILVEDRADAAALVVAARQHLAQSCPAGLIMVQHVREGSAVAEALAVDPNAVKGETLASPYIDFAGHNGWDGYWHSRSRNTRNGYTRRWRKFADLGTVSFDQVTDRAEIRHLLAWTLEHKIAWMKRTGHDNDFIRTAEFAAFLERVVGVDDPGGTMTMFALRLDGRVVATKVGTIDGLRYEGFISSQDPEFGAYSTGTIAMVESLKWLCERGLKYDFRIGDEAYKRDWATHDRPATTCALVNRPAGRRLLQLDAAQMWQRRAINSVRTAVPEAWRSRIKSGLLPGSEPRAGAV